MIEALGIILPIIIYFLLIILLIIVIVLGIKFIITIDKINKIVDDIAQKVESLNSVFKVVNFASDKLSFLGNRMADALTGAVSKLLRFKNRKDEEDFYE